MQQDILPRWERWMYWLLGLSGMFYAWWRLFLEGDALKDTERLYGLENKWNFFGRLQDTTDEEWSLWRENMGLVVVLSIVHILVSQACRALRTSAKFWMQVLVVCDMTFIFVVYGYRPLLSWLLKASFVYLGVKVAGVLGVWAAAIFIMLLTNNGTFQLYQGWYLDILNYRLSYLYIVADGYVVMRLISLGVDFAERWAAQADFKNKTRDGSKKDKKSLQGEGEEPTVLEAFLYLFYFPSFASGPVHLFHEFRTQVKQSLSPSSFNSTNAQEVESPEKREVYMRSPATPDYVDIFKNIARILFWTFFVEFCQHFLYFRAIAQNGLVDKLSLWAVIAVGHATGQIFMVKYILIYGLPSQLGRFDGVAAPPEPRCISWVYSYTDMWKYFDTGLYKFVKYYIFIPLGGSRHGLFRQLTASALAFLFIYIWHGASWYLFIWCCGNFIVSCFEVLAITAEKSSLGQRVVSFIGQANLLRVKCVLFVPAYLTSCLQTFFFIINGTEAQVIVKRVVFQSTWMEFFTIMTIFYACIHNAMFILRCGCQRKKGKTE